MSRDLFKLEKGIHILSENANTGVMVLFGSGAPGGSGLPDDAEQGSLYMRTDGGLYKKKTSGTGADKWELVLAPSIAKWRTENRRHRPID